MTDKLGFIGLLGFKLIFEKDGYFGQESNFFFYVPFRFVGKEPKGRPRGRRLAILPLPLGTPTPSNALFVLTYRSSLPPLSACRTFRSAWILRPLFLLTWHTFGLFRVKHPENAKRGRAFLQKCSLCTSFHPLKASRSKSTPVFLFAFFGHFLAFFFLERKRERK